MSGGEGRPTVRDITREDSSLEDGNLRASPLRLAPPPRSGLPYRSIVLPLSSPSMLHTRARLLPVLATILAAACSRAETPSAQARQVTTSQGEVAPVTAGLSGFDTSLTARAD